MDSKEDSRANAIEARHRLIREKYDELVKIEQEQDRERAYYLPKSYYVHRIASEPMIGLTERYISKIINKGLRGSGK